MMDDGKVREQQLKAEGSIVKDEEKDGELQERGQAASVRDEEGLRERVQMLER